MQSRIMITNGGPHSADAWAVATAETIFDITPNMESGQLILAKETQLAIAKALTPHHNTHQQGERAQPTTDGAEEALIQADVALGDIKAVIAGTPWADRFNDPAAYKTAQITIASHFMTVKDIERQYAAKEQS